MAAVCWPCRMAFRHSICGVDCAAAASAPQGGVSHYQRHQASSSTGSHMACPGCMPQPPLRAITAAEGCPQAVVATVDRRKLHSPIWSCIPYYGQGLSTVWTSYCCNHMTTRRPAISTASNWAHSACTCSLYPPATSNIMEDHVGHGSGHQEPGCLLRASLGMPPVTWLKPVDNMRATSAVALASTAARGWGVSGAAAHRCLGQ